MFGINEKLKEEKVSFRGLLINLATVLKKKRLISYGLITLCSRNIVCGDGLQDVQNILHIAAKGGSQNRISSIRRVTDVIFQDVL